MLRDVKLLFKMARVVVRRCKTVLQDRMVPALGQIDVLDISGRLTIKNSADKNAHGFIKAGFVILGFESLTTSRQAVL